MHAFKQFARIGLALIVVLASSGSAAAQVALDVLHEFTGGTDGARPYLAPLAQGYDGNFYGTTQGGGAQNPPTIFQMTPDGVTTTLHIFDGSDGSNPLGLIQATDGNFYGTTFTGGAFGDGEIYRLTPDGTFTVVYSFDGGPEGSGPMAALLQASDGNFYGTNYYGGFSNRGTIFKMSPNGAVTTVHRFLGGINDGANPAGVLMQARDGSIYGTSQVGGAFDRGTVFQMALDGTVTIVHHFTGGAGGSLPRAALVEGEDDYLYGITQAGGPADLGTIFKMTPEGASFIILHAFSGTSDSGNPLGSLVQGTDGNFYGTTAGGGADLGSIFTVAPDGTFTTLYSFAGPDGASPTAGLVQASDGNFYGTTYGGGAMLGGVAFRLTVP